ncbi:hypothetical protein D9V37_16980 [Nocardioides mangrovicus]|uniref:Chromosome condensation regulator RCC1 n=1 Tax=Nocardioides mangrovicus TaxID=2478913 RepID=A0A3L8NYT6_9ACTN|nr:hypothetical protein [Nocardioides mangrovicus]RLV47817.1 hypothetical protein D9V37_16980 [Nocardioides mangrovicus]
MLSVAVGLVGTARADARPVDRPRALAAAAGVDAHAAALRTSRYVVSLRLSSTSVGAGGSVTATGLVQGSDAVGRRVLLQRWNGHRFATVASGRVSRHHGFAIRTTVTTSGAYLAKLRRHPGHHRAGASPTRRVEVRGPAAPGPTSYATDFRQLAVSTSACSIRSSDESLRCWGYNGHGQLATGGTTPTSSGTPVQIAGSWSSVSTSPGAVCGIKTTGTLWCWGNNASGQVGDGTTTDRTTPVQVGSDSGWTQVSTSATSSCGVLRGTAYCWGDNASGNLGDGTTTDALTPTAVRGDLGFVSVMPAATFSCGRTSSGAIYCWGANTDGELGDGTTTDRITPTAVSLAHVTGSREFDSLSVATIGSHVCAVTREGSAYCWGANTDGKLGDGTTTSQDAPVAVSVAGVPGVTWSRVIASQGSSCGLSTTGLAYCWGFNGNGGLGDGTTTSRTTPQTGDPVGTGTRYTVIDMAYDGGCGLTTTGVTQCWGLDNVHQLGNGSSTSSTTTPVTVSGL